jgi:hypothetical protein
MNEEILRKQLVAQLEAGQAHIEIERAIRKLPAALTGKHVDGLSHTAWEILEHMRIAQWDILNFTLDPNHVTPPWPDEHWPKTEAPPDVEAWDHSLTVFFDELDRVKELACDPKTDLFSAIPQGTGQTVLRGVLLVADHNAYHLGQFMLIRRALERRGTSG